MSRVSFTVLGRPAPQGSMRGFLVGGKVRMRSQLKATMPWRQQVGQTALAIRPTAAIWAGRHEPVTLSAKFYFAPPKKMPKGRTRPSVAPDLDKLHRAVMDAIKGILYVDDGQVVGFSDSGKFYGLPERVEITMEAL